MILAFGFGLGKAATIFPAEPAVEAPTDATPVTTSDETGVFTLPHIPLSLSLSVHGGYDNNFRTSQSAQGSWFTNEGVTITYDSPGKANHLNVKSGADLTYYPDQSGSQTDNVNAYLDVSLTRHVSERLKLDLSVYGTYRSEPDFGSNVGLDSRQGNFFHTLDNISVRYDWTQRFSTVTTDKFKLVQYENASSSGTSLDRFEDTIRQEFRYDLLHRGNTLVAEYRFEVINYDTGPRDSLTHFALLGLDQDFTSYLKLVFRGGATFRSYQTAGSQINPQFEGSLSYSGAHHSGLAWRTSYGIEEPSATGILSRETFRTGLEFKYGLTGRITATVNAYYHHDDNKGTVPTGGSTGMSMSNFSENAFDVSTDLRYVMNRRFSFDVGFQHSEINSDDATRDYVRYRYFAGLTFTY